MPWLDFRFPRQFGRTSMCGPPVSLAARWLTSGKSGNRGRDIRRIPIAQIGENRVRQRAIEVGPDSWLVPQILRLAVASVQPCKGAEQPRVALRRHDGIELGEGCGIESLVCRAPRLDVAR